MFSVEVRFTRKCWWDSKAPTLTTKDQLSFCWIADCHGGILFWTPLWKMRGILEQKMVDPHKLQKLQLQKYAFLAHCVVEISHCRTHYVSISSILIVEWMVLKVVLRMALCLMCLTTSYPVDLQEARGTSRDPRIPSFHRQLDFWVCDSKPIKFDVSELFWCFGKNDGGPVQTNVHMESLG